MKMKSRPGAVICLLFAGWFIASTLYDSSAWARAGGGSSSGSRGSRSFSSPSMPSSPSPSMPSSRPDYSSPGVSRSPGIANQPSSGWFSGSPFWQGLAGGLAGGFLGNLLFGGRGYAAPGVGGGAGGIGLFDIVVLGLLLYFGYRFFTRWRRQREATSYYGDVVSSRPEPAYGPSPGGYTGMTQDRAYGPETELERGLEQIRQFDPNFREDAFKELAQDLFFRIQAGWMNRSLDGVSDLLTSEMAAFFRQEFDRLKKQGRINRLENIAVRKVEITEAWQEQGKDYVTVLFTANLLDYTVDERTGEVMEGDRNNPVKFREFWTFCRDVGTSGWRLSAINQFEEPAQRH